MPTAPINAQGEFLYYEDSGQPKGSTEYLAVVLIHDLIFHGGYSYIRRLFPHAEAHGLRLICPNLRDCPGSSSYTVDDMNASQTREADAQATAVRSLGQELTTFLQHIIQAHNLSPISSQDVARVGGIAALEWGFGNASLLSLVGNAHALSPEVQTLLTRYLQTAIVYDPLPTALGIGPLDGSDNPLYDLTLSLRARSPRYREWVSSYYASAPSLTLENITPQILLEREAFSDESLPSKTRGDDAHIPTVLRMTLDEYASTTEPGVVERSRASEEVVDPTVLHDNLSNAVLGCETLPGVDVLVLWCEMSTADCLWAAKHVRDICREATRKTEFVKVEAGNHFVHWDEPERFLYLLAKHLK